MQRKKKIDNCLYNIKGSLPNKIEPEIIICKAIKNVPKTLKINEFEIKKKNLNPKIPNSNVIAKILEKLL
jgi:hypothetical protein